MIERGIFMVNFEEILDEEMPVKNKSRALSRKRDIYKALRKRSICKEVYHWDWYDNLHEYSKNKVHCSCQMCRFKSVFEPNAKTYSDMKKELSLENKLKEYYKVS